MKLHLRILCLLNIASQAIATTPTFIEAIATRRRARLLKEAFKKNRQ